MKPDLNEQDAELQRNIEEQEQAMSALLRRVMEPPLKPLHDTLAELKVQLAGVQQANAKAAEAVEAGLSEALDNQGKRVKRHFDEVADDIGSFKEDLGTLASVLEKHHAGQTERDKGMQDILHRADSMLAQLDAKADTTATAIAGAARDLTRVEGALDAVRAQQQTVADQLSQELDGMGARLEQQHAHLHDGLARTTTMIEQLDNKASAAGDSLSATAHIVTKVDADLDTLRAQEQAAAGLLNKELNGLGQQLDRQQAQLRERIDTLQPELVAHIESLAATIEGSAKELVRRYEALSETQKALVTTSFQEQLALQLAPFQTRTKWLFTLCGLSFASTLALVGVRLFM